MLLTFTEDAWTDYLLISEIKIGRPSKRINKLIKRYSTGPFSGIGKPEP